MCVPYLFSKVSSAENYLPVLLLRSSDIYSYFFNDSSSSHVTFIVLSSLRTL